MRSGDELITRAIDARGCDRNGANVSPRGNPQTGPFAVDCASPGDVLAVDILAIRPDRATGYAQGIIAPDLVEPDTARLLPEPYVVDWMIDSVRQVAQPVGSSLVANRLEVPLDPMIGCFGVAPDRRQSLSAVTAGRYGGNMDYRAYRAGSTAYFPVFEPGALFFLGDVHAAQSDGEITGNGIEVSAEVRVRLRIVKLADCRWPRGEDDQSIWTIGNARPLLQATQHATSEMLRWLIGDFGMNAVDAHLLLSQSARYDVGNVFDPAYTMACRLPKSLLRSLGLLQ